MKKKVESNVCFDIISKLGDSKLGDNQALPGQKYFKYWYLFLCTNYFFPQQQVYAIFNLCIKYDLILLL